MSRLLIQYGLDVLYGKTYGDSFFYAFYPTILAAYPKPTAKGSSVAQFLETLKANVVNGVHSHIICNMIQKFISDLQYRNLKFQILDQCANYIRENFREILVECGAFDENNPASFGLMACYFTIPVSVAALPYQQQIMIDLLGAFDMIFENSYLPNL